MYTFEHCICKKRHETKIAAIWTQKPIIRPPNPKRREKANILRQIWNSRIPHLSSSPAEKPSQRELLLRPVINERLFLFFSPEAGFFSRCSKLEIWESTISGRNASIFWGISSVQLVNFCVHNRCLRLRPAVVFSCWQKKARENTFGERCCFSCCWNQFHTFDAIWFPQQ